MGALQGYSVEIKGYVWKHSATRRDGLLSVLH